MLQAGKGMQRGCAMRIEQLECFVAVCDGGSFTKAAESLHLVQSAVSKSVSNLESELGFKLLKRSTRHVELTEEGEIFLPHARAAVEEVSAARSEVEKLHNARESTLTVGCTYLYMFKFIPEMCGAFEAECDHAVAVNLIEKEAEATLALVMGGELDASFVPLTDLGLLPSGAQCIQLFRFGEKILVAVGHRLAERGCVSASDLSGETMVWAESAPSRTISVVRREIEDLGIPMTYKITTHSESTYDVLEMVGGITDAPEFYSPNRSGIVEVPYDSDMRITMCLVWREDDRSPVLGKFVRYVGGGVSGWRAALCENAR